MITDMTEQQLKELGFELHAEYPNDDFITRKYRKGEIQVGFFYNSGRLAFSTLDILDVNLQDLTIEEMRVITPIFSKQ